MLPKKPFDSCRHLLGTLFLAVLLFCSFVAPAKAVINVSVAPGGTVDIMIDSVVPSHSGGWGAFTYLALDGPFAKGTTSRATMNGIAVYTWGDGTNNFNATSPNNRVWTGGEALRYTNDGTGLGTTVFVSAAWGNGMDTQAETINIQITNDGASVVSINMMDPSPTVSSSVRWQVVFDKSVTGVTAGNFQLVGGPTGTAITGVSGSGDTWTVTANTGSGTGILGLNMINSTSVQPPVLGLTFTGASYSFQNYPTIVTNPANVTISSGQSATLTATVGSRTASSTDKIYYQWYNAPVGTKANPVCAQGNTSTSPKAISCTVGPLTATPANGYWVDVWNNDPWHNTSTDGKVTVTPPPSVTAISPTAGPTAGGTAITITGTNFTGATAVTIGGVAATSVTVVDTTTITATTPAGTAGAANVAVTTPAGTGTGTGLFSYVAAPTVTAISPSVGPTTGGTAVTITGTNFSGATAVTIGGAAATSFTVVNATTITATTPAGTAGTANVAITTPGGTGTGAGLFTYFAAPTVTGISPSAGPIAGGTTVTISGTNLTGATAVTIGGAAATGITVVNATTITATAPARTAGAASVAVTTPGGTGTGTSLFTYAAAPTVTAISPSTGPTAGGTAVTITGTNLTGATAVTIGGTAATGITVVNATTITATTPAGTAGAANVVVTTPGGTGTGTGLFTYATAPTVTAISPTSGPIAGGTTVTITGTNFTGATAVTIGGSAATGVTVVNATTITATTPAGTAGAANVAVTTPGGTGTGTSLFAYFATPTVTGISPSAGPIAGGTAVTITGTNFTGATAVTIGGAAATSISVVNATTITATAPGGTAGAANVAVTTPGGTGTGTGLFTYAAVPTVTGISPSTGPTAGGTAVTITGTNLTGATAVSIGGVAATSVTVVNATTITATTPAGTAGAANVAVTAPGGTGTGTGLFTYAAAPTVTAISPSTGPTAGGTAVTITGTNLTGATAVTISGVAATGVTVVNATTITATTPAGTAGAATVAVTTPGGTGTGTGLFTYAAAPTVTGISPSAGPTAGGTTITITGTNFTGATAVTIGGVAATGVTVVNATAITATAPAGTAGAANVAVTTPGGTGTGTGLFTYAAVPTVTAISPTSGPAAGGTAVTITGTNFTGATSVTIGGVAATGIAVVNATTITATAPAGTAGAASIVVTTPGGISTEASLFTYIATPTVTGISPSTGPTAGGTGVTITGTNLTGATSVTIGGAAATSLSVVNATTITATTPAGTAGAANVAVTTPGGTGTGTGLFTYAAAPTVTGISPSAGPTAGGTTTTITGANFTGATAVTIGGVAATGVTVVNATTITATTPAGTAGAANVAVTTPGGTGTGTGLFTYFAAPTVTGISPSAGPIAGGTAVTITGTNFTGATAVTIGGAAATSISVVNATTITATTPAGTAGAANVTVTTPGGTDTGTSLFTYAAAPIVTAISPTSGPVAGGTAVTITGTNFTGATAVTIGGAAATSLSVVNATTITATAPGGTAGVTNVVVTTPGGTGTGTGLFTYFTVPILPAANIRVNNQSAPHKIVLIFSENLAPGTIGTGADWTVTANGGTPIYSVATVALANGNEITLTLNAVDLSDPTTYITNGAVNDHIKVTPPSTLTNTTNHAYATGQVTEAGATHTLDTTAPTLAAVGTSAPTSSGGTLAATASEIAKGYWIAVASGATAPTPAQIKAAVAYGGVTIVASGSGALPGGAAGSITLNGLADSTGYDIHVMAEDAAGNATAAISSTTITTAAPPAAPSNSTTTLPTGGGAASPLAGQTVVVTDNGKEGSSITLPTKTTSGGTTSGNAVNVTLPGTGTVSASSSSEGTKLGVTSVTLPGATAPVSTVTVDQGSASFTATKSGQAVAGLKNGIVVVSGSDTSQVSVDTTGTAAKIGIKSSDTIVVPSGAQNVSGTSVDLPAPDAGSAAKPVSVKIGSQEISVQAQQSNTTMTFKVIDIDGVKTPVVEVTGTAQVSSSGDNQPIVSISGNVVRSGTQKCNTVVQASSATGNDAVQVMTCYVILDVGSFSALKGGNGFAAIKDGIVWAGETAEFDKSGKVVAAYLGSKEGTSAAVGDDIVPGGGKFTAASYRNSAFIPRLAGTPLRLNGAKLDESIFKVLSQALGAATIPATPSQSAQGVLSFQLGSDQINAIPTRRIRVDTSRADGVSVSTEGNIEVAGGGLVTIFAPSVGDPQVFAAKVAQALPGAASEQRWNGSWKIAAADGTRYVGRPAWNSRARSGDAAFVGIGDNVLYNDGSYSQMLVADFDDYTTLQTTFANELGDARLTVVPRLDGTALATVNGKTYTLAPQWKLLDAAQAAAKPAWWVDGGMVYIKNADGTAQGFSVM